MSPQITTYSGKHFDITHPNPEAICIEDIAHALSLICRGNGHVTTFYSVGQHCLCQGGPGQEFAISPGPGSPIARCDGMLYV